MEKAPIEERAIDLLFELFYWWLYQVRGFVIIGMILLTIGWFAR